MLINDLGDEVEKGKEVYWTISSIWMFVEISMCKEGGVKDVHIGVPVTYLHYTLISYFVCKSEVKTQRLKTV